MAGLRQSLSPRCGQCIWGKGRGAPRASASESMLRRVASKAAEEERPPRSSSRREVPRREARKKELRTSVERRTVAKTVGEAPLRTKTLSEAASSANIRPLVGCQHAANIEFDWTCSTTKWTCVTHLVTAEGRVIPNLHSRARRLGEEVSARESLGALP